MSERVRVERRDGRLVAVKEARTGAEVALAAEAAVLGRVQGPGVVELVAGDAGAGAGAGAGELVTRWVGTRSLADLETPTDPRRAAAVCLAVAATVGRLHRVGVVHGAIEPRHVLLDPRGRPVLCGFGHAGAVGTPAGDSAPAGATTRGAGSAGARHTGDDVAGLGHLLEHLLGGATAGAHRAPWPGGRHRGARRALARIAARAGAPEAQGRPSLAAFTHAVRRAVPDATLGDAGSDAAPVVGRAEHLGPRTSRPSPDVRRPGRRRGAGGRHGVEDPSSIAGRRPAAVALVVLVVVAATTYCGLAAWWGARAGEPAPAAAAPDAPSTAPPPPTTASTTTATSAGSASITVEPPTAEPAPTTVAPTTALPAPTATVAGAAPAPVVEHEGRRLEVGDPGDVALVGPWLCDGQERVALLRPADGSVHLFDGWATADAPTWSRVVGSAPGATALGAVADGPGCAALALVGDGRVLATLTGEDLR